MNPWEETDYDKLEADPQNYYTGLRRVLHSIPEKILFVETGSYVGNGIQSAISVGYQHIFSLEVTDQYYNLCTSRFASYPSVRILKGDSSSLLPELLPELLPRVDSATLFLDAHMPGVYDSSLLGIQECPILDELSAISDMFFDENIRPGFKLNILIDDLCDFQPDKQHRIALRDLLSQVNRLFRSPSFTLWDTHIDSNLCMISLIR